MKFIIIFEISHYASLAENMSVDPSLSASLSAWSLDVYLSVTDDEAHVGHLVLFISLQCLSRWVAQAKNKHRNCCQKKIVHDPSCPRDRALNFLLKNLRGLLTGSFFLRFATHQAKQNMPHPGHLSLDDAYKEAMEEEHQFHHHFLKRITIDVEAAAADDCHYRDLIAMSRLIRAYLTSSHYGTKSGHFETSKIHFPTS